MEQVENVADILYQDAALLGSPLYSQEQKDVYSIDECFLDVTSYLNTYRMSAHELAITMIREVLYTTGITATAGIGTNMYLAKVAMDIVAKHVKPDKDGVRIAELNERTYRELLWCHTPLTDFWRIGPGISKRLAALNCFTMGDVASIHRASEPKAHSDCRCDRRWHETHCVHHLFCAGRAEIRWEIYHCNRENQEDSPGGPEGHSDEKDGSCRDERHNRHRPDYRNPR